MECISEHDLKSVPYEEIYFGNWINNLDELSSSYKNAEPFSYVVIENFLNENIAHSLSNNFPKPNQNWWHYHNPIEEKYAFDDIKNMDRDLKKYFLMVCKPEFLEKIKTISGIENLEFDPFFHGAGVHYHPPGGKLNMHLDYSINPFSKKERRLNIIYFLNKEWREEWGGNTELWSESMKECKKKIVPKFNTALLFRTFDESWHGLPGYVKCPEGMARKSLAIYYMSEPRKNATMRKKAKFVVRPQDPFDERMQKLLDIRPMRRITEKDLEEIWPNWEVESKSMYQTESKIVE